MKNSAWYRVVLPPSEQSILSGNVNAFGNIKLSYPNFKDIAIPRLCCCCGDKISVEFSNIPIKMLYTLSRTKLGSFGTSLKQAIRTVRFPLCKECKNHIFAENYKGIATLLAIIPFLVGLIIGAIFDNIFLLFLVWVSGFILWIYLLTFIIKKVDEMKKETCATGKSCVSAQNDVFFFNNKHFAEEFAVLNNANYEEVTVSAL